MTTVIGTETFGTDDETVMGGDITTGAVTGGEVGIPGTVEARDCVEGSLAVGSLVASCLVASCSQAFLLPLCRATMAGRG